MKHHPARLLGLILLTCLVTVPAQAQHCELLGASDGPSFAVAAQGDLVVLGSGLWLKVLDIADPAAPILLGELRLPGVVRDIAAQDSLAFVAADGAGLRVVDFRSPAAPVELGHCDTPGPVLGLDQLDDLICLAGWSGLDLVDVSNPAEPRLTGHVETSDTARGVDIAENIAYLAIDQFGLALFDISDPEQPAPLGMLDNSGQAPLSTSVVVRDGLAYLTGDVALKVIDVTDPQAPSLLGSYFNGILSSDVILRGSVAIVATESSVLALDIGLPEAPELITELSIPGWVSGLAQSGEHVFAASSHDGLHVIAAGDSELQQLSLFPFGCFASQVTLVGNHAIVSRSDQLRVMSLEAETHPALLTSLALPGVPHDMELRDSLLYVAAGGEALLVANVGNPNLPQMLTSFPTRDDAVALSLEDGIAYLAEGFGGLQVVDVSDPANPQQVGYFNIDTGYFKDVDVNDGIAVVADDRFGLQMLDVQDPSSPQFIGSLELPGEMTAVARQGTLACVASGTAGLALVDVGDPQQPQLLGSLATGGVAKGLVIQGSLAFLAAGSAGLYVIDISQPDAPVEIAHFNTPGLARELAAVGDTIYMADGDAGLLMIRYDDGTTVAPGPAPRPDSISYLRAWPNPFNPTTTVEYELVRFGPVHVELYDLAGRLVRVLASGEQAAGRHSLRVEGAGLASGLYLLRLTTPTETRGLKLALLR